MVETHAGLSALLGHREVPEEEIGEGRAHQAEGVGEEIDHEETEDEDAGGQEVLHLPHPEPPPNPPHLWR